MTATTAGRSVDAATTRTLLESYRSLVKAGNDSVRAAWRFGQCLDSFTDSWTNYQLAEAMELSISTIQRYLRFYRAYQRPELALKASDQLETYNIDIITELQDQLRPVGHKSLAGRRFAYACLSCHSRKVVRAEIDPATEELLEPLEELALELEAAQ